MMIKLEEIPDNYNIETFYKSIKTDINNNKIINILFKDKIYKTNIEYFTDCYLIYIGKTYFYIYFHDNRDVYIDYLYKGKNITGTEILTFIKFFLKKFNVKKIKLTDGSHVICKSKNSLLFFYVKLLEHNKTYYNKNGFDNKLTTKDYKFIDFFRSIKINDCIIECNNIINICTYVIDNNCYNSFFISDNNKLLNYDILKNVIQNKYFDIEKHRFIKISVYNIMDLLSLARNILYMINYHKKNIDNKNDLFYKCLVDIFNSKNNCDNYINIFTADIIYCIYHKKQQYFIKLFYYLRYFKNINIEHKKHEIILN